MKIINYAHRITESVLQSKLAYAYVNGNLKICLHEQREGKYMFPFNSIDSLHNTFRKSVWPLPNMDISDDEDLNLEVVKNTFLFMYNIIIFLSC